MKKKEVLVLGIIFLIAFGLRFYDMSYPDFQWMDEAGHVPAATNYWDNGQFEPDNWEHPPLRHILLYGFLRVFGDNPYGWRMRNILFGAAAAVLTYLFALEVSGQRKTALLAGLLLATDPLHVVLSRYTFDEVYGGAFFLAAIVLYIRHNRRSLRLILSALLMGCAVATKWNYVPGWFLMYFLALKENNNYRDFRTAIFITGACLLVPLSVYISSYYMWFGRGYSLGEFVEFVVNVYRSFQLYQPHSYDPGLVFLSHTSAWEWFVCPIVVGQGTYIGAGRGEFILFVNNLPIWILTVPSLIWMSILAARKRCIKLALPALFFFFFPPLLFFIRRPAFLYSVTPLLPFAFTAIAYGISQLADRYGMKLYYAVFAVMLVWNMSLFPLVTAKKVPVAPYGYILNNSDVKIH